MNLDKLTKAELITKVEELTKTLASHSHLAEAVDAKDRELHKQETHYKEGLLKVEKDKKEAIALLEKNRAEEIQRVKEGFEKKETSMNYELQELKAKVKQNDDYDKLREQNTMLITEIQRLGRFVNVYTQTFKNFLKGQQGILDNAIELEAVLIEKIQKTKE